jgi:hypothetical protein
MARAKKKKPGAVTSEWLRTNEWGDTSSKPESPEEKRRERARVRHELARRVARLNGEAWSQFDALPASEQQIVMDFFAPPVHPAVVRLGEDASEVAGDVVMIPAGEGIQIESLDEFVAVRVLVNPNATKNALQTDFYNAIQGQLVPQRKRKVALTKDPTWRDIELIDLHYYSVRELTTSEERARRRAMSAARRYYRAWKEW